MPHVLNLFDGSNAISLTTNGVMLSQYTPQTASKRRDGRGYEDVTDAIELLLYASTTQQMQAILAQINGFLERAGDRHATDYGPRHFIRYQPIGDPYLWRAEVRSGSVMLAPNAMTAFGQAKMAVRLIITRAGEWEGPLLELAGSTKTQPEAATGGRTIQNRNDVSGGNYFDVAPGVVLGELKTPAMLRITNNMTSSQQPRNIYVATTGNMDVTHFNHTIEGEDALGGGGTPIVSGAHNSSDSVLQINFSGSHIIRWTVSGNMINSLGGRVVRLLSRWNWIPAQPPVFVRTTLSGIALAGDERQLPANHEFVDLGSVRFPTARFDSPAPGQIVMTLRSAQTVQLELDYLHLAVTTSGFRKIEYTGSGLAQGRAVVDDPIEGLAYSMVGTGHLPDVSAYGDPLWIYPGPQPQRLYFLIDRGTTAPVQSTMQVRIFYRPRRLTI